MNRRAISGNFLFNEMWLYFLIIFLSVCKVESETICNFEYCGCIYNDVNLIVDCAFGQKALESNLSLPDQTVILDLSKSNLTYLQLSNLLISDKVEELLLNNNNIHEINENSIQLPELKRLDLSYNHLQVIKPEVFVEIIKLEYLNLANNKFKEISQLRFHPLVNLKEIILDKNNVGADIQNRSLFDVNGCGLTLEIQSISLSEINLRDLKQDYFLPAKSLTNLTVTKNNITLIFDLPTTLLYLDLSENPVKLLKIDWSNGPFLRVLKANNLKIEKIQKNALVAQFFELQLEGNKYLTNFSHLAFGAQILRDDYDFSINNLSIRGSNLSTLDKKLWILLKKVERLDLQDNPWTCDCRIAWFLKLPIPDYLTENLKCASPPHLNNTKIFNLELKDLICLETEAGGSSYRTGVTMGLILYSSLLIVTLMWVYFCLCLPRFMALKNKYYKM